MALTFNYSTLGSANANKAENKKDTNVYTTPTGEFVERDGKIVLAVYISAEDLAKSKPMEWQDKDGKAQKGNLAGIFLNNFAVSAPDGKQFIVDWRNGKGQHPFAKVIPA